MNKKFENYTLEDFLSDVDFCKWARSESAELNDHYKDLLKKYPDQEASFQKAKKLVNFFDDEKLSTDPLRKLQIWEQINATYQKQQQRLRRKIYLRYAAVVAVVLSIGSLITYQINSSFNNDFVSAEYIKNYSETKLQVSNGKSIRIESDQSKIVYENEGKQIQVGDKLVEQETAGQSMRENELIVPYGKQSKIILADATEVWLNAGSRLVFPASFDGNERKVRLQGEAFFKVSKDKSKPFIVETSKMRINVLGTSFNVKAYPEEEFHETVLAEGLVNLDVKKLFSTKSILMKPADRVVVGEKDKDYSLSRVNVTDYTSWIDGVFIFNNEPIQSVLLRVSRFYNLETHWDQSAETTKISGKLDLKQDYKRVLYSLGIISGGTFTIKNNSIYYKQNKD